MVKKQRIINMSSLNFWVFILLLLISIFSYSAKENLKLGIVKNISAAMLFPLEKTINFTVNTFSLHKKNSELRKEIALISLEIQRCENIKRENKILRELYGFKPMMDFNLIPCEIIGKNPGLYNKSLIIDGGFEDNIDKNMAVISADGLVGKIIETTQKSSEVLTLYNINSFVSAIDLRSRVPGIIKWKRERFLIFDDVPLHSDIKVGDTLLTSGMGGVFPKGIFIGKVIKVQESPKEIVMRITIQPFFDFNLLEEVFVITEGTDTSLISLPKTDTVRVSMINLDMFKKIKETQNFYISFSENKKPKINLLKNINH